MWRTMIVVVATAMMAAPAAGATWYVDQAAGDDAAEGTEAAPFATVARGVEAIEAGDTLVIGPGVYRESVAVKAMGRPDARITITAAPDARPVLSGGDRITGWQAAAAEQVDGNPHADKIATVEIGWEPTVLYADGREQQVARTPNEGWWSCTATPTTIADPEHLTQDDPDAWQGATVFFFRYKGVAQMRRPVAGFDPETDTLTVEPPLSANPRITYTPGSDRYILENTPRMIDRPGEWSWRESGEGRYRIFYWPEADNVAAATIEAPRRKRILNLGSTAYCTVDGLELRHAVYPGRTPDAAIGNDANKHVEGAGRGIVVRNCSIHHNNRFGWQGRRYEDLTLENNLIHDNQYGIAIGVSSDVTVVGNEIARNAVDGIIIGHGSHDVTVRRNYIHHHNLFGHPDNIQMYRDVSDIAFDSNLILSAGQSVMMEGTDSITFHNNVVAGSAANMMICGHGNAHNYTWTRNTFALWASSLFILTGRNYTMSENMMVNNGGRLMYSIPAEGTFSSNKNLLWRMSGVGFRLAGKRTGDKTLWFDSIEAIREQAGNETDSVYAAPEFANVPDYCTTLDNRRIGDCTSARLVLRDNGSLFEVGDVVEVHFDGVVRKVTAREGNTITIDPPLETAPDRVLFVVNWQDRTDFTLDFSSPHNDEYGSTIDVPAYFKGDFDGDGRRDVPDYRD